MPRHTLSASCSIAALLFLCACQDIPKHKMSSGKFNEWASYEGKHFEPSTGTVVAVDPAAGTVTIGGKAHSTIFTVTPRTRIMHEGTDITLAQLPLNQSIKYTLSDDGSQLLTIWYGQHANNPSHAAAQHKDRTTFF